MRTLPSPKRCLIGAALLAAAIAVAAVPAWASIVWSDDCESFANWPTWSGMSQPTLSSTPDPIQSGSHAFKFNNASNRVYHDLPSAPSTSAPFVYRFWLYDDGQNLKSSISDIRTSGATRLLGAGIYAGAGSYNSSTYQVRILPQPSGSDSQGWLNMTGVSRSNGWHRFEIYCNNSTGAASFYVDGILGLGGYSTASGASFAQLVVGAGVTASSYTTTQSVDTVAVLQNPTKVTFVTSGSGTIGVSVNGTTFSSPNGYYDTAETLVLTASPGPGYSFAGWSSTGGWSSSNATVNYTPEAGNPTVTATFVSGAYQVSTTVCPSGAGSVTGAGWYDPGDLVTVDATPSAGYNFVYWTDDSCSGSHVVSYNHLYSFNMPSNAVSLFAHFAPATYTLTRIACGGGTVGGTSGSIQAGTQCTVTATPNPGWCFLGWTTDGCSSYSYVSKDTNYTFNMPANNYTLYAKFARALMVEEFEAYNLGGTSFESIDKNDPAGPNQAANGSGNPWWGPLPPNGRITQARSHTGARSLWGTAGGCRDFYNLAYRVGGGSAITGNVYLDWWFYDPLGSGGSATNFCGDYTALTYYSGMPLALDHPNPAPSSMPSGLQQLAIGMSDDVAAGYDPAKYQVRVVGAAGSYHNGWFNTNITRSVGWHHARVVVGPRKTPSNTNDVTFFIDDMANPVLPAKDTTTTAGFNMIEVCTIMPQAGTIGSSYGAVYSKYLHFSYVDDISFGALPSAPGASPSTNVGIGSITWNWTDGSGGAAGFWLWDAASGGVMKGSAGAGILAYPESGLDANTLYSRWVEAVDPQYAGDMLSARTALPTTCTLAVAPVYGASGAGAIGCNNGAGSSSIRYPTGTSTVFAAVNGFGSGPLKASKYIYFWNTTPGEPTNWTGASQWTAGSLTVTADAGGSYYLHLRACNQDGVANPNTLTLGPYVYETATPVATISDAWGCADGVLITLTGKPVTAAFAGDSFWIEEPNRSAGMKVAYGSTSAAWQDRLVTVTGVLDSTQKPRTLVASLVQDLGPAPQPITPLAMALRGVGGADFNAGTPGITAGVGLYNVGLLAKVAGNVSFADNTTDPNNKYFFIDDGSSLPIYGGHPGIKVKCGAATAPTSGMVSVTGVVSMESTPGGYVPVLVIRQAADIVPVPH